MKTLILTLLLSISSFAADVRFIWLPTATNVPGVEQTTTPVTQYGVQVFLDSDNQNVTEFAVTLVIQDAAGEIRSVSGKAPRVGKAETVRYSTALVVWVGTDPNYQVLSVTVKGSSSKNVTRPIPGKDYAGE